MEEVPDCTMTNVKTMIRFSFLIPFWNLDPWILQRMLDSIPHRADVEILLLDNASDDVDKERFPGMGDANVRVIFQNERKTVGYCRNALIEQARGEWVIFADADDRFFTEELERLMDRTETADYDLIYWGLQQLFPDGSVIDDSMGCQGEGIQPMADRHYAMAHKYESPHKMVRRSLLIEHPDIRFDEIPIYEDVAYAIRLLLHAEKVGVYPPMVYQYIRRETSTLGKSWPVEVMEETLRHLYPILDLLQAHHYSILAQESTKGCLIRMKKASRWHFCIALLEELRRYGWPLFYRDLVGAGFETYETSLLKALTDHLRVKIGGLIHKKRNNE